MALARTPDRLEEAAVEVQKAIALDPDSPIPHNNLGSILMQVGRRREAAAESHYNAAITLAKSPGKEPEAIEEFQAAIRLNPNYAEAHNNLGVVLAGNPAKTTEAIEQFQTALKINPNYAEAHYNP